MRSIYDLTMADLVAQYNTATADKGINPVTKFKDLKTGQARLFAVIKSEEVDLPPLEKAAPKPVAEKKTNGKKNGKPVKAKKEAADHDEFSVRVGSNRNKLFNLLKKAAGKAVPVAKAVEAVYGNGSGSIGALGGVIKGCEENAGKGGYRLTKDGKGEKMTLTLTVSK